MATIRVRQAVAMGADEWDRLINPPQMRPIREGSRDRNWPRRKLSALADLSTALGIPVGYVVEERLETVP